MNIGNRKSAITIAVPVVLILIPALISVVGYVFGQSRHESAPFIEVPGRGETSCVADVEWMRLHHWELLDQIRERVVRDGEREGIRLKDCRDCHANREHFCNQCHRAANVNLDCFGCHYYPATPDSTFEEVQVESMEADG